MRTCLTAPAPAGGTRAPLPSRAPDTSRTTRSGLCKTSKLWRALPDKSTTTRVPSGPAQRRTLRTSTANAGCKSSVASNDPKQHCSN
jgi:hypothetical protein